MPLLTDALDAIQQRLVSECKRVHEIRREKQKLAEAYDRYVALQNELRQHEKRIDRLVGIIGPDGFLEAMRKDESSAIGDTVEVHTSARQLREELPLWEAMQEYLLYATEARIQDIQLFLGACGIEASREAIESALRRHPEAFRTRKKKREKFVSLK